MVRLTGAASRHDRNQSGVFWGYHQRKLGVPGADGQSLQISHGRGEAVQAIRPQGAVSVRYAGGVSQLALEGLDTDAPLWRTPAAKVKLVL